jgi:hypothetical protein
MDATTKVCCVIVIALLAWQFARAIVLVMKRQKLTCG